MGHSSRMSGSLYSRMTRGSQFLIKEWEWPTMLLLFWRFIMYATAGTLLGIFAYFIQVQQQMNLGSPWYACRRVDLTVADFGQAVCVRSDGRHNHSSLSNHWRSGVTEKASHTATSHAAYIHTVCAVSHRFHRDCNHPLWVSCTYLDIDAQVGQRNAKCHDRAISMAHAMRT